MQAVKGKSRIFFVKKENPSSAIGCLSCRQVLFTENALFGFHNAKKIHEKSCKTPVLLAILPGIRYNQYWNSME